MPNVLTTITARDYLNLRQENSEKNIINQTFGDEYIIDTSQSITLEDLYGRDTEFNIDPLDGGVNAFPYDSQAWELRRGLVYKWLGLKNEYYYHSGSFTIETDTVISDPNSIAVELTLEYDQYHIDRNTQGLNPTNLISASNYNSNVSAYEPMKIEAYKTNGETRLTAQTNLPYETSSLKVTAAIFGFEQQNSPLSNAFPPTNIMTDIKKVYVAGGGEHYQITVRYSVCTWWGKNYHETNVYATTSSADLMAVKKIKFKITANKVNARNSEFTYKRDVTSSYRNAIGKNYDIDSNELIQTEEETIYTNRTSYQISNEIFDAFDTDRSVVSFILLNCDKYLVGEEQRYLRTEDLIYIEDENGELISDDIAANGDMVPSVFEIIKTRPIWDGTFSMEIVCRKIDMTPNNE